MVYKVEIKNKPGIFDAVGEGIKKDILDLGIKTVQDVRFIQVYNLETNLPSAEVKRICEELLVDSIAQEYIISEKGQSPQLEAPQPMAPQHKGLLGVPSAWEKLGAPLSAGTVPSLVSPQIIEVAYNPGVMDPVEESALKGIRDMGIEGVSAFKAAKKYVIQGNLSASELKIICDKLLHNKLIQHIIKPPVLEGNDPACRQAGASVTLQKISPPTPNYRLNLVSVDLLGATDKKLEKISQAGQLFLNLREMLKIQGYFTRQKRNPTDVELETIAQTWSEHCMHKTFRGRIKYSEKTPKKSQALNPKLKTGPINNLLKSTIMKATKELNKPWCVSVFQDNSGVVKFDEAYNACFKVETHNHPSALEPFGGANTGIGGVIRDPLGTGLGAKPILNTDVFCFGPPDYSFNKLPKGTLHPKRVMKGVVAGVKDYGNKMGIPTINGSVHFHERFVGNPLVFCGTAGILPKEKSFKETKTGDLIVVVGGRTGRDGIHGATFSSGELTHESETISSAAVQIGDPIQEKKMLDVILQARDLNLYSAITDCGAGGLSSAVGEMAKDLGCRLDLEKVPLKYAGLSYTEIWISESQERMVLSVAKENIQKLLEVFLKENVEASVIGEFTDSKRLKLFYQGSQVCDLDMRFLHKGVPQIEKKAAFVALKHREPKFACPTNLTKTLFKLLSHYDICSKEWIIRQYDHEVQGGSVLKPLTGIVNDGPSDAAVVTPVLGSNKGLIISNGINFRYGLVDPYWMAASCIDEALRQIISVGGSLEQVAILDNFCWGNPDKSDRLGSLVRAAYGCYDIAKAYGTPFISGKDSFYNEFSVHHRSVSIPGTLLISAMAVMPDINKTVSMYAKQAGDLVYVVGQTLDELGGSHYYDLSGLTGNSVPRVNPKAGKKIFSAISQASSLKLIKAMHDCSEGGIGVAAAEMAFSGGLGMELFISEIPYLCAKCHTLNSRNDFILFSESNSRFIVEVEKKKQKEFENILKGLPFGLLGRVSKEKEFKVYGLDNKVCVKANIEELKEAWQKPLRG